MVKKKNIGRPFTITTQEMSAVTWIIGFSIFFVTIMNIRGFPVEIIIIYLISAFVMGAAMFQPNWMITKYNLNMIIDKMTNPNYEGWIRVTTNKKVYFKIVEAGPLGQTKGIMSGDPADVINKGDYTVAFQNGNHAILVNDSMSVNANLEEELGWKLMHKKYGVFGYEAYRRAAKEHQIDTDVVEEDLNPVKKEEI